MDDRALSSRPVSDAPAPDRLRTLGLDRNPFTGPGPRVAIPAHDEALGTIRGWIDGIAADPARPDRLAVLTGVAGSGRSRLLHELVGTAQVPAAMPMIDPGKAGLTDAQLLRAIIDAFGGTTTGRTGMELRRDIRLALADLPDDTVPGLLIDDADFSGARLELIRNVLRDGADAGLWIVLAGQPDLADRLARRRSFRALLGPMVTLGALTDDDARTLLRQRIDAATVERGTRPLLAPEAVDAMVAWAGDNPGRLLRLAEVSLLGALRQGMPTVERPAVQLAIAQLEGPSEPGATTRSGAIQAEIPLFGDSGRAGPAQRSLWEGGMADDQVPD